MKVLKNRTLTLSKETICSLTDDQAKAVKGGLDTGSMWCRGTWIDCKVTENVN